MEHATFHTLNNQGDNLAHNDGHGEQQLSLVCATMLLRALLVDPAQQLGWALLRAVGTKLGSTRRLWERLRALCDDDALQSLRHLLEALLSGLKKPSPIFAVDSASSRLGLCVQPYALESAHVPSPWRSCA